MKQQSYCSDLKSKLMFTLIFFFLCTTHVLAKTEGPNYTQLNYEKGIALSSIGDLNGAKAYLINALMLSPNHIPTLIKLGSVYIDNSEPKEAIPLLERASLLSPADPNVHFLLGLAYQKNDQFKNAIQSFQKSLSLSPGNHLINLNIGLCCKLQNDDQCAIDYLGKIILAYPNVLKARVALASAYHNQKNLGQAKIHYDEILRMDPNNIYVIYNLIGILLSEGKYTEALEKINDAISKEPDFVDLYLDRARINYELGNLQDAENDYIKAVQLDKVNPEIPKEFANFLIRTGAVKEAATQLDIALALQPDDIELLINKAYLLHNAMSYDAAQEAWTGLLKVENENELSLYNLALIEIENKKYENAIEFFTKLLDLKSKNKEEDSLAKFGLAFCYQKLNESEKARTIYENLLSKDSKNADVNFNLAVLLAKAGENEKAIELFHAALENDFAEQKLVYESLIEVYEDMEDIVHQKLCYERLLDIDQNNIEARVRYAQFLKERGDSREALNQFLVASTLDKTATSKLKAAKFLVEQNDHYGAIDQLQDYLKIYANDLDALKLLAKTFQEINIDDQAINTYKRIIALESGNYIAYYNLGLLYAKSSERDEAQNNFLKSLEIKSDFAPSYFALGISYLDDQQNDQAKISLEKYLRLEPEGEYKDIAESKLKELVLKVGNVKS